MISTVFHISLLRLWNNKQELLLALVVPILFFSIFALILGDGVGRGSPTIKVAIVDDDRTPLTEEIADLLKNQLDIQIDAGVLRTYDQWPIEKLTRAVIRAHGADVVIHLANGMERGLFTADKVAIHLLSEGTNPIGQQVIAAMLAQIVSAAAAKMEQPIQLVSTPPRRVASADPFARLSPIRATEKQKAEQSADALTQVQTAQHIPSNLFTVETTDVFAADKHNPKIAMYAAGIAVMFLLFSATGAGGGLLEEYEAGTLDRLLSSRLTITELLAGKWIYITCLGCVQLTVMFVWAQVAFGVDLFGHIAGFAVMTLCTAAATASLALCLAVFCRSRSQLNGVSIVLILTMSALGGSMVPRYIMSAEMQRWGHLTFNAWALDGFKKVFWYDLSVASLNTEIRVLLVMAIAFAIVARVFADRWAAD